MHSSRTSEALVPSALDQPHLPRVRIIVLNWNGKDDTLNCLESLQALSYPDFGVIVVDNGSSDGSVEAIRHRFPEVELLCTGRNLGYAGGNNVALRACLERNESGYVLILNNDTEVHAGMLEILVRAAEEAGPLTVVGPRIFFKDNPERIWFAGAYWEADKMKFDRYLHRKAATEAEEVYETDYVTGCALFMSVETLRKTGLLDERFFLIYEEVEWCYRVRSLGGRCLVAPRAQMWHSVSSSFGGEGVPLVHYFEARNELLWAEKALSLGQRFGLLANAVAIVLLPELWSKHRPPAPLIKRIYWSIVSKSAWDKTLYRDRTYRSRVAGLRDYLLRRFGDCPPAIRAKS